MKYFKPAFKLTILSNISMLFLHESKSDCGSHSYGLPADFIHSFCSCNEHMIPVDFSALAINLVYHLVIWFSILYLWQDAKETWAMMFAKNKVS